MRLPATRQAMRSIGNALRTKRFRASDMSDHMLRDIGFLDGRPPLSCSGICDADAPLRSLDRFALPRFSS